jgi:hypothetical protein
MASTIESAVANKKTFLANTNNKQLWRGDSLAEFEISGGHCANNICSLCLSFGWRVYQKTGAQTYSRNTGGGKTPPDGNRLLRKSLAGNTG